jgi:predicted AAA+ superfamily ATPase
METEELRNIILQDPGKLLRKLKDSAATDKMARLLWEIAASSEESKEIKKAAKKALYTLRSSGINVDIQKPQKGVQKEVDKPEEIEQAVLSIPDSKDNSLLIISTSNRKTLSLDIHQILLDNRKGIVDYRVNSMSRRSFEKLKTENEDFFPVPIPYSLSRLHRAMELSGSLGGSLSQLMTLNHSGSRLRRLRQAG